MPIPNRQDVEAQLAEATPKELSELLLVVGKLLMRSRTTPTDSAPFICVEMDDAGEKELALYCRGRLAERLGATFKAQVGRYGGTQQEL